MLSRLQHRREDQPSQLKARLDVFQQSAQEMKEIFGVRMRQIDGQRDHAIVLAEMKARIESRPVAPRLVITGPPASGKGSQSSMIVSTQLDILGRLA